MINSMFDVLMELPLFRGVSRERMSKTVGTSRFHFQRYGDGEAIVTAGEPCGNVLFVISGSVRTVIGARGGRLELAQTLAAPAVVAPDFLFGRATIYPCSATAVGQTGVLRVAKGDYVSILNSDDVFLFNYLNYLSMNAQKSVDGALTLAEGGIEQQVAFCVEALTQPNALDIVLTSRSCDIHALFGGQRAMSVAALDRMRNKGLIDYGLNEIRIVNRRDLLRDSRIGVGDYCANASGSVYDDSDRHDVS